MADKVITYKERRLLKKPIEEVAKEFAQGREYYIYDDWARRVFFIYLDCPPEIGFRFVEE